MFTIFSLFSLLSVGDIGSATQFVTCGSITKLYNTQYDVRLHSHDVKYGSGSGQQSVTGSKLAEDHNSNWRVKGTPGAPCTRGEPISCGTSIRLEHVATSRNLHSHLFSSPLSDQQEVSCFGEEGEGDTGDVWKVNCDTGVWQRGDSVTLRHVDTDRLLAVSHAVYGRPISGQHEVVGQNRAGPGARWQSKEGVFVQKGEELKNWEVAHEEL